MTRRLRATGLSAATLYGLLGLASVLTGGAPDIGWWLVLSGLLTAAVTVAAVRLIERPYPGDDGPPAPAPPPDPPPWWPEFERAFRDHAARPRDRV